MLRWLCSSIACLASLGRSGHHWHHPPHLPCVPGLEMNSAELMLEVNSIGKLHSLRLSFPHRHAEAAGKNMLPHTAAAVIQPCTGPFRDGSFCLSASGKKKMERTAGSLAASFHPTEPPGWLQIPPSRPLLAARREVHLCFWSVAGWLTYWPRQKAGPGCGRAHLTWCPEFLCSAPWSQLRWMVCLHRDWDLLGSSSGAGRWGRPCD